MYNFVDIHTHTRVIQKNVLSITNVFPEKVLPVHPFSVGIHPWYIAEKWRKQLELVYSKAQKFHCYALGECGLDKNIATPIAIQEEVFLEHILLANELEKPLIIHCVGAYDVLQKMIKLAKVPMILHDYGRNATLAKQLQQQGVYLSVGKALFRPQFDMVLQSLDTAQLFLETDDMDCSIELVYEKGAKFLSIDISRLKKQIYKNFKNIFSDDRLVS